MNTCPECGAEARPKKYRHVTDVGGVKVSDESTLVSTCSACGACDLTLAQMAGYERRAAALVLRSVAKATGPMVRAARKALELSQPDLGALLECSAETVSRWENDRAAVPRNTALALVGVLELVERHNLNVRELIEALQQTPSPRELELKADEAA